MTGDAPRSSPFDAPRSPGSPGGRGASPFPHARLPTRLTALLVELEGIVADTTIARRSALASALAAVGRELSPDALADAADGVPAATAASAAARALALDPTDEELTALRADRAFDDAMAAGIVLMPGARDALASVASRARIVIVTRAPVRVAERIVALADLDAHVLGIVAAAPMLPAKPSPAGHLRALARLGRLGIADRAEVVALEDGPAGIAAARAAGVGVVGVGPRGREAGDAAPWLASLAGVTYDALVELLVTHGSRDS